VAVKKIVVAADVIEGMTEVVTVVATVGRTNACSTTGWPPNVPETTPRLTGSAMTCAGEASRLTTISVVAAAAAAIVVVEEVVAMIAVTTVVAGPALATAVEAIPAPAHVAAAPARVIAVDFVLFLSTRKKRDPGRGGLACPTSKCGFGLCVAYTMKIL
jgi:hypothetical protein